jgi:choline dehydrogenase-like flavoprotein
MRLDTDIIIVGSGVGGATVAKELVKKGKKVLVVEKGRPFPLARIGTVRYAYNFYDKHGTWSKTKEGIFYYRAIMLGGTSIISCGNGVRALEKEFKNLGIDLTKEFLETEQELSIRPVPENFIGRGTKKIVMAADKLGFNMVPMPKFIKFEKCICCGNCALGCRRDAKWTSLKYLKEAQDNGISLLTGINVTNILVYNSKASGIEGYSEIGEKIRISAKAVVLAAGAIGTAVILQASGIRAGEKLFLDLFNVTVGITKEVGSANELTMAAVSRQDGFILSPFMDNWLALASVLPKWRILNVMRRQHMLGVMTKIEDDCVGRVYKDGFIEKTVTSKDLSRLKKGADVSREILIQAGANPRSVIITKVRGAHPGGTAAIGEVVDKNLETKIKGLFICDASVLPFTPGLPPIVTIIALAKKFATSFVY